MTDHRKDAETRVEQWDRDAAVACGLHPDAFGRAFARHREAAYQRGLVDAGVERAVRDVVAERARQVSVEGWSAEHDDEHTDGSLAVAAATYAIGSCVPTIERGIMDDFGRSGTPYHVHSLWPWDNDWFKPKSRRFDLVRAAALIVAEIERLDRMESRHDQRSH